MDNSRVNINTDMEFEAVFPCVLSAYADVIPEATVLGAKPGAVHRDGHFPAAEGPDDAMHHPADVRERQTGHPPMDDTMTGESIILVMKIVTVMKIGLDAIISQVKSFLEKTTDSHSPGVMPPPPPRVGGPGWRKLLYSSDDCRNKELVEVAVHMVHNQWIHAFLCRSHPENTRDFLLIIYFGMKPPNYSRFITKRFVNPH